MLMQVNEFSYGPVTPALGFAMSFLGAFLGLRCAARAGANDGWARRRWLVLAGVSLGLSCVWVGHFIEMLGFAVPGGTVLYNVPETLASAVLAVAAMCAGLFIAGRGRRVGRLLLGGLLAGLGIASMHYIGMAAMRMPGAVSYNPAWLLVSSAVAVAGGIAVVWSAPGLHGIRATVGASLIIGAAVGGTHYAGMAAMRMSAQSMAMAVHGATASGFLLPLILVTTILTYVVTFIIAIAPSEDELHEETTLQARIAELNRRLSDRAR